MSLLRKVVVVKGRQGRPGVDEGKERQRADRRAERLIREARDRAVEFFCPRCGIRINRASKPKRCPKGHKL